MESLTTSAQNVLNKIIAFFQNLTPNLTFAMIETGGDALSFMEGYPVSTMDVVNDDDELTDRQNQNGQGITTAVNFFDRRDGRLYTYDNGNWPSVIYTGDRSFLRPKTLCFSPYKRRFYFCDEFYRLTPVALTRAPVVN